MATKRVISLRNNEVLVKIEGAAGAVTIDLDVDLLGAHEVLDGQTVTVNIAGIVWTTTTGTATIVRNAVQVMSCAGPTGSLGPNNGFQLENGGNTNDIVITTATAEVQIWLKLHKVKGFQTKYQSEQYGSYDDPTSASA